MKKALPPGIGFTSETAHTLLADRQTTEPTEIPDPAHACCQSSYSQKPSSFSAPASRIDNKNVTDCAFYLPNRINISSETISNSTKDEREQTKQTIHCASNVNVPYNRAGFSTKTFFESHGVHGKTKSRNTSSHSDAEKMSEASSSNQTEITEPTNSVGPGQIIEKKAVRKGASLSFDDLEDDTIYAVDCKTKVLNTVPDGIPKDLPRIKLEKGGRRGCFFKKIDEDSEEVSEVYIEHSQATDSELGDRFGATIKTIPTPGDKYFEHFFTTVEKDGVAEHMRIRSEDQLVLLNGTFLPDFGHQTVLQLISRVPVDSHTRLSLVLLRRIDKKKWIWINTSAILVPEYHSEPAVIEPHFGESHVTYHEERHLVRLKVEGTCLFIAIDNGHACLEVSETGENEAKFDICVWERCGLDSSTGRLSYSACIYRQSENNQYQNDYLTIECGLTGGVKCSLKSWRNGCLATLQALVMWENFVSRNTPTTSTPTRLKREQEPSVLVLVIVSV